MDNLTHTLIGASLAETGLKEHSGLATATLVIASNLPDIDALSWLFGENLAFRRGITHGLIALLLMPLMLATAMVRFDHWQAARGTWPPSRARVRFFPLLCFGYIGVSLHLLFDFLNSYGVRLLMPFSDRWFSSNALFIFDPWIWLALGVGLWRAWRQHKNNLPHARRPAVTALCLTAAYSFLMLVGSWMTEHAVPWQLAALGNSKPDAVVASPPPVNPLARTIVYRAGNAFGFGELRWEPAPRVVLASELLPTHMNDPAVAHAARHDRKAADFLYWSQWPFADIERNADETIVTLGDARYGRSPGSGHFVSRTTLSEPLR